METASTNIEELGHSPRRVAQRLAAIGENRIELLMVELQEERERLFLAILMALGIAGFALLAGIVVSVTIVVAFWDHYPIIAMLVLAGIYLTISASIYARLTRLQKDWHTLPEALHQLKKDRECLEQIFS